MLGFLLRRDLHLELVQVVYEVALHVLGALSCELEVLRVFWEVKLAPGMSELAHLRSRSSLPQELGPQGTYRWSSLLDCR